MRLRPRIHNEKQPKENNLILYEESRDSAFVRRTLVAFSSNLKMTVHATNILVASREQMTCISLFGRYQSLSSTFSLTMVVMIHPVRSISCVQNDKLKQLGKLAVGDTKGQLSTVVQNLSVHALENERRKSLQLFPIADRNCSTGLNSKT